VEHIATQQSSYNLDLVGQQTSAESNGPARFVSVMPNKSFRRTAKKAALFAAR
jgi:hypothetical protein